jgi:hypothetical protein
MTASYTHGGSDQGSQLASIIGDALASAGG